MTCFGGSAPSVPLPAPTPQPISGTVQAQADAERQRRRAAAANTILTSAQGAPAPQLAGKSMLGS